MNNIRVLGIETSCDETSVSIVEKTRKGKINILSNIVNFTLGTFRLKKNKEIIKELNKLK